MSHEETLEELEMRDQEMQTRVSIEEKKALIAEAKRRHGKDYLKFFSGAKSGIDWQSLKFKLKGG